MANHIPGPLYFEQQGASGTPMLFLHSTPDELRFWMFQAAHFSAWYRTVAVDMAGYGRSPAVQPGVTVADQAQACWEVMDRITGGGVIIHGNSMGAMVARHMVLQRPQQSLALILSGTGFTSNMREVQQRWKERYAAEGLPLRHFQVLDHFSERAKKDPLVLHYADMVMELNNVGTLQSIIAMNDALSDAGMGEAEMARIATPTLIIAGREDRSYATVHELQKRIKGSVLRIIEGAGHACNFEAPREYDRHCIEFLRLLGLHPG